MVKLIIPLITIISQIHGEGLYNISNLISTGASAVSIPNSFRYTKDATSYSLPVFILTVSE